MSAPPKASGVPLTNRSQLVEYLASGEKPRERWRIGTEHEKFVFTLEDGKPLPYDGPRGIRALLESLVRFGWTPVLENDKPIALTRDDCSITLEPGGQFELSGAPLETIHGTCAEIGRHLDELRQVGTELGIGLLGLGFQPKWRRQEIPWMPKGRYAIMRAYMPKKGNLGLDMMLRTCTVQVNLDYDSEADMIRKFRVGLALQPVATALFANSPFVEGKPSGLLSYRSHVWTDTDPDRTGMLPFVLDPGFGYERYIDYILKVPMYFVYRDGRYIDASGQSFADFLDGRLPALPGEVPTTADFTDHLTTAFPEVRLKKFLEMRGADGGPWKRLCALPALWVGLIYDSAALDEASELIKRWSADDIQAMRRDVPRLALQARVRGQTVHEVAVEMVAIAKRGLAARAKADSCGANPDAIDETPFLAPLEEIVRTGRTPAHELLENYRVRWGGSVDPVFREYAY